MDPSQNTNQKQIFPYVFDKLQRSKSYRNAKVRSSKADRISKNTVVSSYFEFQFKNGRRRFGLEIENDTTSVLWTFPKAYNTISKFDVTFSIYSIYYSRSNPLSSKKPLFQLLRLGCYLLPNICDHSLSPFNKYLRLFEF